MTPAGDDPEDRFATGLEDDALPSEGELALAREQMVCRQIEARGVTHPRVLAALRHVPRHRFVPAHLCIDAYDDCPLPIGHGQTISQPYVVAAMTEALDPQPHHVVLEVGAGCGYQTAVLAALVRRVYAIEIVPELAAQARATLAALGIENAEIVIGDGWNGLATHAPYDGILVGAAPERVPEALLEQLAPGGRLVVPVGGAGRQELRVLRRGAHDVETSTLMDVRFVPLVHGAAD